MKRTLVKIASVLFPKAITSFAYDQLTNPQIRKLREHELETIHKAHTEDFPFMGFNIKLYTWGSGSRKVLLIHGWEGQAGNFSDIIDRLLENDYTVYAFDAPSHGFSSKGSTSLFEFTELVGVLIRKYDARQLISHSFGGVATTYALFNNKDLEIDTYILLTTPDTFLERINDVAEFTGITTKIKGALINRLEQENNFDVKELGVSAFVKTIRVKKAIIIHDKNDKVIPVERALNVHRNWKASQFKEIEGTGHFRILRTKGVIDDIIAYLN